MVNQAGRLGDASHRAAQREWASYRTEIDFIDLTATLADNAALLAVKHALSGADAVHLATALGVRAGSIVLASWDQRLARAALAEGLVVVPKPT